MASQAARLGRAAVRGEPGGGLSGDAGGPPYPAPESRRSPQLSKAPPVPPGPSGEPAQVKGREAARGPRGRKTAGAGGEAGLPEDQSLPERQRRVWEARPAGSKAGAREHHRRPERRLHSGAGAEAHAPPWTPGTVPSEARAISHTQGKRPRWLLDLVKFSFNQTRLIIDSTRMKLE